MRAAGISSSFGLNGASSVGFRDELNPLNMPPDTASKRDAIQECMIRKITINFKLSYK